ncbi:hypothetical protein L2E82_35682 [Cichorium intybus]|uniref:Uncharacterized protein n=1 Tax=Cichorium intybus TaxID=13427 RepID=A0ACB9BPJ7_CICIN|nr:hypothetical protein L2E82_35682 [Cichorium intybus]
MTICDDDLPKGVIIIYRYTCMGTTCQLVADRYLIGRSSAVNCDWLICLARLMCHSGIGTHGNRPFATIESGEVQPGLWRLAVRLNAGESCRWHAGERLCVSV